MSQTVVGLLPTPADAQRIKQQLVQQGYPAGSIRVLSNETDGFAEAATSEVRTSETSEPGIMGSIKNFFHSFSGSSDSEQDYYTKGVSAGGSLVAVSVDNDRVDAVASLLESYGAKDVSEEGGSSAAGTRAASTTAATTGTAVAAGEAIPIMEEELQIGKRQVSRGGVRVYSHVVETPVEQDVRLREEHVRVQRTPVDRPVSAADLNSFKEGTIELTETGEEVVVAKQARVVEEVRVGKEVTERTQKVSDTVRHTEVDVEEIPAEVSTKVSSAGKL